MKRLLSLAAGIAAVAAPVAIVASHVARAVEDPPQPHYMLLEAESMLPVLESYNSITAGTATVSTVVRQPQTGSVLYSGQAADRFDNHNADGSRMTLPFEVDWPDTYGVAAGIVKGPVYGTIQFAIDGRPIGGPIDTYAAALARPDAIPLGGLELSKGKHTVTVTVIGKNDASTDYQAGLDFLELDSEAAPAPEPTPVASVPAGGTVDPTLALTVATPASFGAFTPGVAKDYPASTIANVISTAGDAALTVADPSSTATGHLINGSYSLPQALKVSGSALSSAVTVKTWTGPVSNDPVTVPFTQAIGANDAIRTGTYAKTLTFTLSTTNP